MKYNKSKDVIKTRCEFLESMGFTINHEDSNVSITGHPEYTFDFSATHMDSIYILRTMISKVESDAFEAGVESLREDLNKLLKG